LLVFAHRGETKGTPARMKKLGEKYPGNCPGSGEKTC